MALQVKLFEFHFLQSFAIKSILKLGKSQLCVPIVTQRGYNENSFKN